MTDGAVVKQARRELHLTRSQVAAMMPGWNWYDVFQLERERRELAPWQAQLLRKGLEAAALKEAGMRV